MQRASLEASRREEHGKGPNRRLRARGLIPAVVYGRGREARSLSITPGEVASILNGAYGKNTVVDLRIEDEDEPRMTLIKHYQLHSWKRMLQHVDFWEIHPEQVLTLEVPLVQIGDSPARRAGGRIHQVRDSLWIRCLPRDIPAGIEFDMSQVPAETHNIMVSQVSTPEGVEPIYRHDFNVMRVKMPRVAAGSGG